MFSTEDGNGNYYMSDTIAHTQNFPSVYGYFYIQSVTGGSNEIWAKVPYKNKRKYPYYHVSGHI